MKETIELYMNYLEDCETTKYLKKYSVPFFNESQSFSFFVQLLYTIPFYENEKLKIKFYMKRNINFGRDYIRYSIFLEDRISREIFIQIPFNSYTYKKNSLFAIANVYEEIIQNSLIIDNDFYSDFNELLETAYNRFIIKNND